jgi:sialic acid synthase SpsE
VEKHFTLSRSIPGPDSSFSIEPQEFRDMVESIRTTEKALGAVSYELSEREAKSRVFRRSLYAVKNIEAGAIITRDDIRSIRPGYGLHPRHLNEVLGKRAVRDIRRGTPLDWDLLV